MGGSPVQIRIPKPVPDGLTVIETMRAEPDGSIRLWPLHLARLRRDCAAVGFPLDENAVADALGPLPHDHAQRVRLTIDIHGQVLVNRLPLKPSPPSWAIAISDIILDSHNPWLRIKTSNRGAFDTARKAMPDGCDEVILLNERGEVCEGSITNIFLRRKHGETLLTPSGICGLLPGVLRQSLLDDGQAEETILQPADLTSGDLYCGNALRGLMPAQVVRNAGA